MTRRWTIENVAGVDVRITRGEGKPLMLLVRMASGGMGIWDAIWDQIAQHYTVANFDLVASAKLSEDMPPRERFLHLAQRNVDVAAALGFDTFHVFGWYGGTHIALALMHAHRDRVRSAILLDPFFQLPDGRKLDKAIAFKKRIFDNEDRTLYAYYWVMAGFSPQFLENHFDVIDELARARIEADKFVSLDTGKWMRWVRALRTNWLDDAELAAMNVPTLVLATELDPWHAGPTIGMAETLAMRMPRARLDAIKGYGTFFFIENAALFADKSSAFLEANSTR